MNSLEILTNKFEGQDVKIIEIDGEVLFELYSTGMALGQVKTAKGKIYPNKDRIDKNVKNAEISTVAHNAQQYLTEEMLYDLMLETKTEKVKPFRKWITKEVLPSLRKTGQYSINNQTPNDMVANLVQSTMTAILPVITQEMAKVTLQNQEQINQAREFIYDQSVIHDKEVEVIKDLIGFRCVNTAKMVNALKEKLSDKLGVRIMANNKEFLKIKKLLFKEFRVIKWEDIPVQDFNKVYAFIEENISDMF